jgi:hypothetical protein
MLKPPLYALLLAAEKPMWHAACAGLKQISIRTGHRDYQANRPMILATPDWNWTAMVDITSVRHCLAIELTENEIKADGFRDLPDMLKQMKRFYPEITESSEVTVIRWDNIRGKLVEDYKRWVFEEGPVEPVHLDPDA